MKKRIAPRSKKVKRAHLLRELPKWMGKSISDGGGMIRFQTSSIPIEVLKAQRSGPPPTPEELGEVLRIERGPALEAHGKATAKAIDDALDAIYRGRTTSSYWDFDRWGFTLPQVVSILSGGIPPTRDQARFHLREREAFEALEVLLSQGWIEEGGRYRKPGWFTSVEKDDSSTAPIEGQPPGTEGPYSVKDLLKIWSSFKGLSERTLRRKIAGRVEEGSLIRIPGQNRFWLRRS